MLLLCKIPLEKIKKSFKVENRKLFVSSHGGSMVVGFLFWGKWL
jgi:hypothetical protein